MLSKQQAMRLYSSFNVRQKQYVRILTTRQGYAFERAVLAVGNGNGPYCIRYGRDERKPRPLWLRIVDFLFVLLATILICAFAIWVVRYNLWISELLYVL